MAFTNNDPEQDPKSVTMSRKDIKRLEEAAREGREAKAELEQLRRERSFMAAGVPLDDPRAEYFVAGYKGDQTPEAIKTEWQTKFGTPTQGPGQQHQEQVEYELGQLTAAQDAATAAPNIPPDKLAERDAKLAALNPGDPRMGEKFDAIFAEYGGKRGGLVG